MKNVKLIFLFSGLFLVQLSCSSDDSPVTPNENDPAVGTYVLTELNIDPAQDINEDGNTTSNVLTELPCATGTLNLNADSTYSWTFIDINATTITGGLFKLSCSSENLTDSGQWQVQNGQLTLFDGSSTILFTVSDDKLTNTTDEELPGFISTVYEKQ